MIGKQIEEVARSHLQRKDAYKFKECNVLIAMGVAGSSSAMYAAYCSPVNPGVYKATDVVGISVNGARRGRVSFDASEVKLAIEAGATLVTDKPVDRDRAFNVGERELASWLRDHDYVETNGVWRPKEK